MLDTKLRPQAQWKYPADTKFSLPHRVQSPVQTADCSTEHTGLQAAGTTRLITLKCITWYSKIINIAKY